MNESYSLPQTTAHIHKRQRNIPREISKEKFWVEMSVVYDLFLFTPATSLAFLLRLCKSISAYAHGVSVSQATTLKLRKYGSPDKPLASLDGKQVIPPIAAHTAA